MNIRSLTAANKWTGGVLFNKDFIFCNKMDRIKVRVQGVWTKEGLFYFEFGGGDTTQEIGIKKENFELLTTYSAKRLCIIPVTGNLSFGILQLGEVLTF